MAILIKGMEMPTECEYCGFCRYYPENGNVWCNAKNRLLKRNWEKPQWTHLDVKRPAWCPLEELPSAQPEQRWIPVAKEQILQAGYEGREVRFHIGGRLFAIRELAQ